MILTPQADYKKSPHAKLMHEAVASTWFQEAAKTALVEMQSRMINPSDLHTASSWYFRLAGAKQYLDILMKLTEEPGPKPEAINQNLQHKI